MSSAISSSPTFRERAAASPRSSGERQPPRRRITYVFKGVSLPSLSPSTLGAEGAQANRENSLCLAARLLSFGEQPEPGGGCSRLAAGPHLELAQDRADVVVHGSRRDDEPSGDVGIS